MLSGSERNTFAKKLPRLTEIDEKLKEGLYEEDECAKTEALVIESMNFQEALVAVELNSVAPADLDAHIANLQTCLEHFNMYAPRPTVEEIVQKQKLGTILRNAADKLALQKKTSDWGKIRVSVNKEHACLVVQKLQEANLEQRADKLNNVLKYYAKYSDVLSELEIANKVATEKLLNATNLLLQERSEAIQQAHKQRELQIKQKLQQAKACLDANRLKEALSALKYAREFSRFIISADGLQDKNLAKNGYFDNSINSLKDYIDSLETEPLRKARSIVADALELKIVTDKYEDRDPGSNYFLHERHHKRLINTLVVEFSRHWPNFYQKAVKETSQVFSNVALRIVQDLDFTSRAQRWAPLNWTYASYCLRYGQSHFTADNASSYIASYKPEQKFEFNFNVLPAEEIFEPRTRDVAKIGGV